MIYNSIVKGYFVERLNRFIALVEINGSIETCHVRNTGRCKELFLKGALVYLEYSENPKRKTKYSLVTVKKGERLINIDSQIPNYVVFNALEKGLIKEIGGIKFLKREETFKASRFDIYFENLNGKKGFIEVKGVTLEENGVARFPDAPSERAIKHLNHLIAAKREGFLSYVLFLIQMKGVKYFEPNFEMHLKFAETLKAASLEGVKILAYDSIVKENEIYINETVKIKL